MSLFDDTYRTITGPAVGEFAAKGSKFIGYAYPLQDEIAVKEFVAHLKREHPKAQHYCWGYRLTPDRSVFRINDDGEPSGTAGRPILNTMLSVDVTNILVVVVRYFGGTLLGVRGLINAYKTAAQEALSAAEIVDRTINDVYRVSFVYEQTNAVTRIVKEEGLTVLEQDFDRNCTLLFGVRQQHVDRVLARLFKIEGLKPQYVRTL